MPEATDGSHAAARPRWTRVLFPLGAVALTLAACGVVFEIGLRIFRPDLHPESGNVLRSCHEFHPTLGWRPRANCSGRFVKEDFDTQITTNGNHVRGRLGAVARTPTVARVAVLGDSFAWGYGVNDHESFAALLDQGLADADVLNFGVCGYGTDQAYLRYREEGRAFAPDLVILAFFAANDFSNNVAGRHEPAFRPYFDFDATGVLRAQNLPLPPRPTVLGPRPAGFDEVAQQWSFAYRYLYLKAKLLGAVAKELPFAARLRANRRGHSLEAEGRSRAMPLYTADPPADTAEAITVTLALLDKLRGAVAEDDAQLLLLVIPQRAEVVADEWARELRRRNLDPADHDPGRPHRRVAEWAVSRGVPVVNLFEAFSTDPNAQAYFLPTDRHFSTTGHVRCAELLLPRVRAALEQVAAAPGRPPDREAPGASLGDLRPL